MQRLEVSKYHKWYWAIIDNRLINQPRGYSEKHHINPKSFGGSDEKRNIVRLTAREHFICHLLLTKMFPRDAEKTAKMVKAWCWMAWSKIGGRRYKVNSRIFEAMKKRHSEVASINQTENNSQSGTRWIYNEDLKECRKIEKKIDIPSGWKKGRVLNWDSYFKKKDRLREIGARPVEENGRSGTIYEKECKFCKKKFRAKYSAKMFCNKSCANMDSFNNVSKMIKVGRGGEEKKIKPQNLLSYTKIGWKKIE